jgi:phosphoribosylformimino-5-aminoimidazole carboxamide ribotide isomerase
MLLRRTKPRIIPVLDVMNGQVVRAVGGRRDEYRPIVSKLTTSTEPIEVAKALIEATGATELYVADLDAITGMDRSGRTVASLAEQCGVRLFADMGIRTKRDVRSMPRHKNIVPVLGSETISGPTVTYPLGDGDWAFSLDLFNDRLMGNWAAWSGFDVCSDEHVWEMADTAIGVCGAGTIIVIDLAKVGTGTGPGTEYWCRKIRATWPEVEEVEIIAGGGVRSWEDVQQLGEFCADAVLVASALHDGTITFPPTSSAAHP